jgi:hypothetical protein
VLILQLVERHLKKFGRPSLALLLAALVLLLNLLAASPSLHERFHSDAGHAEHQCAVTLFAHGQTDSAVVEVTAVLPVTADEFLPLVSVSLTAAPMAMLPPGRAPPMASIQS